MKKFLLITLLLLALPVLVQAAPLVPYLVCDPVPTTAVQPTSYTVTLDTAAAIDVPAFKNPDNSVQLRYDLSGVALGVHVVGLKAKNIWGESASVPFSFTKALPATPTNVGISAL